MKRLSFLIATFLLFGNHGYAFTLSNANLVESSAIGYLNKGFDLLTTCMNADRGQTVWAEADCPAGHTCSLLIYDVSENMMEVLSSGSGTIREVATTESAGLTCWLLTSLTGFEEDLAFIILYRGRPTDF